jgi:hypothetical protein
VKAKKKSEPQGIKLGTAKRGKKKMVTIVMGLASYGLFNIDSFVYVIINYQAHILCNPVC